MLRMFIS